VLDWIVLLVIKTKTFTPLFGLNTQFFFPLSWGREGQNVAYKKGISPFFGNQIS